MKPNDAVLIGRQFVGTVVEFRGDRGFGFVTADALRNERKIFIHANQCRERALAKGLRVRYTVDAGRLPGTIQAVRVQVLP